MQEEVAAAINNAKNNQKIPTYLYRQEKKEEKRTNKKVKKPETVVVIKLCFQPSSSLFPILFSRMPILRILYGTYDQPRRHERDSIALYLYYIYY